MPTANERLVESQLEHALELQGYSLAVMNKMLATLNRADRALFTKLTEQMGKLNPDTFTMERLDGLLKSVRSLQVDTFNAIHTDMRGELKEFVEYEVGYQEGVLVDVLPTQVRVAKIGVDEVYAAANARPFQGTLLRNALDDIEANRAKIIRRTVADGFVQQKTTDEIVRELRGTKAKGYSDGLMERPRHEVQAVVRTSLSHYASFAQQKVYDKNKDILKGYVWVATLDDRTSSECGERDGLEYDLNFNPVGHSLPWGAGPGRLHWNCRSRQSPVLKSWRELGADVDEFTPRTRASLDGQVPANTNFKEWVAKQPANKQKAAANPMPVTLAGLRAR